MQTRGARRPMALLLGACAVLGSTLASATVVIGLDRTALIRGADGIVAGVVDHVRAIPGPKQGPEIMTRIDIRVEQTFLPIQGVTGPTLTLIQTGGTLHGRTMLVHGQAQFRRGERVLVFVERVSDGRLIPYGMAQGKFTIAEHDGHTVATRDLADLALATQDAEGYQRIGPAGKAFPVRFDLGELEAAIADEAGGATTGPIDAPPAKARRGADVR
jgi:hypothetical protein